MDGRCYPQPANEHQIEIDLNCITIQEMMRLHSPKQVTNRLWKFHDTGRHWTTFGKSNEFLVVSHETAKNRIDEMNFSRDGTLSFIIAHLVFVLFCSIDGLHLRCRGHVYVGQVHRLMNRLSDWAERASLWLVIPVFVIAS